MGVRPRTPWGVMFWDRDELESMRRQPADPCLQDGSIVRRVVVPLAHQELNLMFDTLCVSLRRIILFHSMKGDIPRGTCGDFINFEVLWLRSSVYCLDCYLLTNYSYSMSYDPAPHIAGLRLLQPSRVHIEMVHGETVVSSWTKKLLHVLWSSGPHS